MVVTIILDYMIILASRVQALSKHLMRLLWKLIALNDNAEDEQTRFSRHLMIKLVENLSNNKGIMFHVLGIPLSYASLLKLTHWSTSFLLLLLHKGI